MENKRASGARRSAPGETKRPHPRSPDSLQERGAAQLLPSPQAVQDEARRRSPSSGSPGTVWAHWEMQVPGGSPGPAASPPGAVPHRGAKVQEKKLLKRWGTLRGASHPAAVRGSALGWRRCGRFGFGRWGARRREEITAGGPPGKERQRAGRWAGLITGACCGRGSELPWGGRAGHAAIATAPWLFSWQERGRARCLHPEPGVEPPPPAALPRANSIKEAEVARLIFLSRVFFFFF